MIKLHLSIATNDVDGMINDNSQRFGCLPCVVIPNEYALWRSDLINASIRRDTDCATGALRHLGWEDPRAQEFTASRDINGIIWERFSPGLQAEEIEAAWPGTGYMPNPNLSHDGARDAPSTRNASPAVRAKSV